MPTTPQETLNRAQEELEVYYKELNSTERSEQANAEKLDAEQLDRERVLKKILFDAVYRGKWFSNFIQMFFNCEVEIVEKLVGQIGFVVQVKRWIVERTFSWFEAFRRLSKDYEMKTIYSEAWIYLSMTKIMLNRLA